MIDRYLWGDVRRISPEAPVPVATVEHIEERPGGAANVLHNIWALGGEACGLYSPGSAPIVKVRVIGRHQQMLRIDFDCPQEAISLDAFRAASWDCRFVVFSDYGKGSLQNIQPLISQARLQDMTVLVDPKGHNYEKYRGAHLIKPNLDEMKELVGGWDTEEQLTEKAQRLRADLELQGLLLTRGAAGMTLYLEEAEWTIPSEAREVYDVSGAGDTTIAAFTVGLSRLLDWPVAAKYANKAAGIVVGRFGTAVATEKEVFSVAL